MWPTTLIGTGVGWLLGSILGRPLLGAAVGALGGYVYGSQPAVGAAPPTSPVVPTLMPTPTRTPTVVAPTSDTGPSTDPLSSANVAAGTSSYDAGGGGGSF